MKLITDRLILREFQELDWQAVHEWDSDPEVVRFLMSDCERTEEAARAKVRAAMATACQEPRGKYAWIIGAKERDQAVGELDLNVSNSRVSAWVRYRVHPDHRGRGYVTEALRRVLQFGFEELHLHRIKLTADPRNTASLRVAEKLGMRCEGVCRDEAWIEGEWKTEVYFAMLDHEWRALGSAAAPPAGIRPADRDRIARECERRRDRPAPPVSPVTVRPVCLTTDRLVLREFDERDATAIHSMASTPAAIERMWLSLEDVTSMDAAREYVRERILPSDEEPRRRYALALAARSDSRFLGELALEDGMLGYQVHRELLEQGLLTEALSALLQFGFERLKVHRIVGNFPTDNVTAARVMAELGMQHEAHFVEVRSEDGRWISLYEYAMLDADWAARSEEHAAAGAALAPSGARR
jgi:[ribosomal protein S5]-alanine N-acetyltransferase